MHWGGTRREEEVARVMREDGGDKGDVMGVKKCERMELGEEF